MDGVSVLNRLTSSKTVVPVAWLTAILTYPREGAAEVALGTSIATLAANVLKHIVWEQRPRLLSETPEQSFPSGHSSASTAYFLGLAMMAPPAYRIVALGAAASGAAAVNILRVETRHHWPIDVMVGDALAVAATAGVAVASRKLRSRRADSS